jgi:hypothetical protein
LLTKKICYVFILSMRVQTNSMVKAARRTAGGLSVRGLNISLLILLSIIVLLLIGRGAGTG